MNILFVGYSSLVQRKVLPAAIKSKSIEKISIATHKYPDLSNIPDVKIGEIYNNYDEAISKTNNALVYISFPNALHALWAKNALLSGHHVIVDKPAFMTYSEARSLTSLAQSANLLLAEANVWTCHSLFKEIQKYMKGKIPHSIYANFSSPPLEHDNFRYNPDMGAGILLDRGSYAISCVRELLKNSPDKIFCSQRFSKSLSNVDIDLSVLMEYYNKTTFLGFFSLECEYTNSLEIIGEDFRVYANRPFTPPPEKELEIEIQSNNTLSTIKTQPCDAFQVFLEDIVNSIHDSSYIKYNNLLLNDAALFERLRDATHQKSAI